MSDSILIPLVKTNLNDVAMLSNVQHNEKVSDMLKWALSSPVANLFIRDTDEAITFYANNAGDIIHAQDDKCEYTYSSFSSKRTYSHISDEHSDTYTGEEEIRIKNGGVESYIKEYGEDKFTKVFDAGSTYSIEFSIKGGNNILLLYWLIMRYVLSVQSNLLLTTQGWLSNYSALHNDVFIGDKSNRLYEFVIDNIHLAPLLAPVNLMGKVPRPIADISLTDHFIYYTKDVEFVDINHSKVTYDLMSNIMFPSHKSPGYGVEYLGVEAGKLLGQMYDYKFINTVYYLSMLSSYRCCNLLPYYYSYKENSNSDIIVTSSNMNTKNFYTNHLEKYEKLLHDLKRLKANQALDFTGYRIGNQDKTVTLLINFFVTFKFSLHSKDFNRNILEIFPKVSFYIKDNNLQDVTHLLDKYVGYLQISEYSSMLI